MTKIKKTTITRPGCYDDLPDMVEVDLMDTRAADSIRIVYDFERDGYSILQASMFVFGTDTPEEDRDEDWREVAFVKAWQRQSCEDPSLEWAKADCGALCPVCSEEP